MQWKPQRCESKNGGNGTAARPAEGRDVKILWLLKLEVLTDQRIDHSGFSGRSEMGRIPLKRMVGARGFEPECGQARIRASPITGEPECGQASDPLVPNPNAGKPECGQARMRASQVLYQLARIRG
jgi:hypothetical protein